MSTPIINYETAIPATQAALSREQIAEIDALAERAATGPWTRLTVYSSEEDVQWSTALRNAWPALRSMALASARTEELERALAELVRALDACEPAIADAFLFQDIHGIHYTGPTYNVELEAARKLSALPDASKEKPDNV